MTVKTNINSFLRKFKANQQLALDASAKATNSTLREMYKLIVERTPIGNPSLWNSPAPEGYKPGTLKKSWRLNFTGTLRNARGQFTSTNTLLNSGGLSFKVGVNDFGKGATIYNAQPYAQRVETGWSSQAPSGMMRLTIAQYSVLMAKNAAKYRIR